MKKLSIRDMAQISLGAALMAVCAWITVPTPVPFTMQTFAVFCAAGLLGGRKATLSVALYIALGAVGLPVFSGFRGGVGALFGATGGYIWGFPALTLVYGACTRGGRNAMPTTVVGMALGLLATYALGTAWFLFVYARASGGMGLGAALGLCVLPFLPADAAKLALAALLTRRLRPLIARSAE